MKVSVVAADRIPGMMPPALLSVLASAADHASPHPIAEVGCWRGRTTRVLCDHTRGPVYAVDTWDGSPGLEEEMAFMRSHTGDRDWVFHEFQRNLAGAGQLQIIREPSVIAASVLWHKGIRFAMVFIDALHDYDSVRKDIQAWLPLMMRGGLLCGHDFTFPEVNRAVTEAFPELAENPDPHADIWGVRLGVAAGVEA